MKITREIYRDPFSPQREVEKLPKGSDIDQLDSRHEIPYSQFRLKVPCGEYDDGSRRYDIWMMEGAEIHLREGGYYVVGFAYPDMIDGEVVDQDDKWMYSKERWWVAL